MFDTTKRNERVVHGGALLGGIGLFGTLAVGAAIGLGITGMALWQALFPVAMVVGVVTAAIGDMGEVERTTEVEADGPTLQELASDD